MWRRLELPTWFVAAGVYGGFILLTSSYYALPWWFVVPAAAFTIAWHGSLQHEAIHGHPTRSRWLNAAIAGLPLSLWMPYELYRESHLAHHGTRRLTDPFDDPESYYVPADRWRRMRMPGRALHWIMATLAGRLLVGPIVVIARFYAAELGRLAAGDREHLRAWLIHGGGSALVLAWVIGTCGIPVWAYAAMFVYPGLSLTLLRSFTEHRPADDRSHACAIVEAGPIFSLVFLENNLHALHHAEPDVPWYELRSRYRRNRDAILRENGAFVFAGYFEIARRFLLSPKDNPIHPEGEQT